MSRSNRVGVFINLMLRIGSFTLFLKLMKLFKYFRRVKLVTRNGILYHFVQITFELLDTNEKQQRI